MEILYYYRSKDPENPIVAEFGLRIPEWDITFNKMRLVRTLNGTLFVAAPSREWKNKDGKKEYEDYWYFGKETSTRFKKKVLDVVQEYIRQKFGSDSHK